MEKNPKQQLQEFCEWIGLPNPSYCMTGYIYSDTNERGYSCILRVGDREVTKERSSTQEATAAAAQKMLKKIKKKTSEFRVELIESSKHISDCHTHIFWCLVCVSCFLLEFCSIYILHTS